MPRMIGDFNDNANALWSLHLDEAKSHDESRIHSLKDDMDSVLIFVCLFKNKFHHHRLPQAHALAIRPVYSPLPSLPFLSIRFMTFKSIQHSRWSTTSNRMSHFLLRSPSRFPLSPHRSPSRPFYLHHIPLSNQTHLMSGSTLSGS